MKILYKSITIISLILPTLVIAVNNSTDSVNISPNKDNYKIKLVANLSDLPIIDNKWYPSNYTDGVDNKIRKDDRMPNASTIITVNNNTIYRLEEYKLRDGYTKKFNIDEKQLRLCKSPMNNSHWDCSILLKTSAEGNTFGGSILHSPDGSDIAILLDETVFIYQPTTNQVSKFSMLTYVLNGYSGFRSDGYTYFKNGNLYKSTEITNPKFKNIIQIERTNLFYKEFSCVNEIDYYNSIWLQDKQYAMYNGRIYTVTGSILDSNLAIGSQIGELNSAINIGSNLLGLYNDGRIQSSNNNIYIQAQLDNTPLYSKNAKINIFYLPTSANQNSKWNLLTIKISNYNSLLSVMANPMSLIQNEKKLYISIASDDGDNFSHVNSYLYEISK